MASHLLSKSSFIKGLQCHKALYLYKNYYYLRDAVPPERKAVFNRGHEVGFLARRLFPGGIDASPVRISEFSGSVLKTRELISNGTNVIYEPAFLWNEVLIALDIICPAPSPQNNQPAVQRWNAFEVKSSARISTAYILDAALQYYVIRNAGVEISDFFILNLNTNYVRRGALEYEKLFSRTSVMEEIVRIQPFIEENISRQKNILSKKNIPEIPIGTQCFEPYSCDFMGYCWRNAPKNPTPGIPGKPPRYKHELLNPLKDSPGESENAPLNELHKIHLESKKADRPVAHFPEIKKFLGSLRYPLFFMDFEVMMPAIPLFDGTRPFQNIPFQYSICKAPAPGDGVKVNACKEEPINPEYSSFLAESGCDPRKDFIENFLKDSEGSGSLIVYDSVLEKSVLNSLKKEFPQYGEKIDQRIERITDLMILFKNKFLYSHKMGGNFSLKHVSNAFLPGINFEKLKISNGRMAMIAYESLQKETDILKIIETREALLEYSKTDTEAMLEVIKLIEKLVKDHFEEQTQ